MTDEVTHFLLVFDHHARELADLQPFEDFDKAVAAYDEAEDLHALEKHIEVVLLGAESLDVLRKTHPGFFQAAGTSTADRARILLSAVAEP